MDELGSPLELTSCLICNRRCAKSSASDLILLTHPNDKDSASEDHNSQLELESGIMFVFRRLLKVPWSICEGLLESHGAPLGWGVSFCLHCQELIEQGQEISVKIQHILQKWKCLQQTLQDLLQQEHEGHDDQDHHPKAQKIRMELRSWLLKSNPGGNAGLEEGPEGHEGSFGVTKKSPESLDFEDELQDLFHPNEYFQPEGVICVDLSEDYYEASEEPLHKDKKPRTKTKRDLTPDKNKVDCPMCQKPFRSVNYLNLHYKKIHMGVDSAIDRSRQRALKKKRVRLENARQKERKYLFECVDPNCNQHFPSKYFRDAHFKRKHQGIKKPFECRKCFRAFHRHQSLVAHKKGCTRKNSDENIKRHREAGIGTLYKCQICSETFRRRLTLNSHLKSAHDDEWVEPSLPIKEEVDDDNKEWTSPLQYFQDDSNSQEESRFSDFIPSGSDDEMARKTKPKSKRRRLSSNRSGGDKNKFKCPFDSCDKKFSREVLRDGHFKKVHQGVEKPFSCDVTDCNKSFKSYMALNIHNQSCHSVNTSTAFCCETCGKLYYNKSVFKTHVLNHSSRRTHPCPECGKTFRSQKQLERHSSTHLNQPQPKCDVCDASFKTSLHLFNHRLAVHRIYAPLKRPSLTTPFMCDKCPKSFIHGASLKRHCNVAHEHKFKFVCSICQKGYGDKTSYQRHYRSHTGEKPHVCHICGKGLTRNSDLVRHLRIHTGEKPYSCDICQEPFADGSRLQKHMKTSHADPKYPCDICHKKFHTFTRARLHKQIHDKDKEAKSNQNNKTGVIVPVDKEKPKRQTPATTTSTTGRKRGRPKKQQDEDTSESGGGHNHNSSASSHPMPSTSYNPPDINKPNNPEVHEIISHEVMPPGYQDHACI